MNQDRGIFGGRRSLFGDEGSDMVVVDLNLTPLMDVMSNILFFLLASFGAAILSFMAASVPVEAEPEVVMTQAPRTDRVTVNIQLKAEGYAINLFGDKVPEEKLAKFKTVIPKKGGAYDDAALKAWAFELKGAFPASDTAVIVPSDTTRYHEIILTMEALRWKSLEGNRRMRLLPKIVVADLVKAPAIPETEAEAPEPPPAPDGQ